MAGATSWFSLRRRTPVRYVGERATRLLTPFIIGAIVLTPIQAYYEFIHKGWWQGGSFVEFLLLHAVLLFGGGWFAGVGMASVPRHARVLCLTHIVEHQ